MSKEKGKRAALALLQRTLVGILAVAVVVGTTGSSGGNQPLSGGCPRMVFYSLTEEEGAIWSAPAEGGAAMKIWNGPDPMSMGNDAVQMSPDCTEVLIQHVEMEPDRWTIMVARVDQYGARELVAPAAGHARLPVWAPNGEHIYYIREYSRPLEPHSEIWRIGRDGSGDTMLINLGHAFAYESTLVPSPDGSRLLLTVDQGSGESGRNSLWLVDLQQGSVTPIFEETGDQEPVGGIFSLDGRYVAYMVDFYVNPEEETDFWESELRIRDLVTGEERVVAPRLPRQMWVIPTVDDYRSLWSQDGSEFLAVLVAVDDPDNDGSQEIAIYRIPVDGSGPILVRPPVDCDVSEPGWTADHSKIRFLESCAFSEPPGPVAVKTILPDGSGETVIPVTVPGEVDRYGLLHR